jgi:glycosyltransferase involved in cell wall biosynthesis
VGGTHPCALEAMAAGRRVVVSDTPENLETVRDVGVSYPGEMGGLGLRPILERLLKDPALVAEQGARGRERVRIHYTWDGVTDAYERLLREVVEKGR